MKWFLYALLCFCLGIALGMSQVRIDSIEPSYEHGQWSEGTITNQFANVSITKRFCSAVSDYTSAISNAVDSGTQVINLPVGWDVPQNSNDLRRTCEYAGSHGVLIVCAAPNVDGDAGNYDKPGWVNFPSHFGLSNVITVAGCHTNGNPIFSRSTNWFDLVAPAWNVPPFGLHGNSWACALTTAAIARILDRWPQDNARQRLLDGLDVEPRYAAFVRTAGRLNGDRSMAPYATLTIESSGNFSEWTSYSSTRVLMWQTQQFFRVRME